MIYVHHHPDPVRVDRVYYRILTTSPGHQALLAPHTTPHRTIPHIDHSSSRHRHLLLLHDGRNLQHGLMRMLMLMAVLMLLLILMEPPIPMMRILTLASQMLLAASISPMSIVLEQGDAGGQIAGAVVGRVDELGPLEGLAFEAAVGVPGPGLAGGAGVGAVAERDGEFLAADFLPAPFAVEGGGVVGGVVCYEVHFWCIRL